MTQLKLGRLPKSGMVRLRVAIPETLKEELDRYAAEYSELYQPADAATLIPHMLESFIRSDRGYRRRRGGRSQGERQSVLMTKSAITPPSREADDGSPT